MQKNGLHFNKKNVDTVTNNKIGILITNIGTPSNPTFFSLFRYLSEFLGDPRIVKINKFLWFPILYGLVLPFRSGLSTSKYKKIWTEEGSPLALHTHKQYLALQKRLFEKYKDKIIISYGMRYGYKSSIKEGLNELKKNDIDKLLIFPLFPQKSESTVSSTFDCVTRHIQEWTNIPSIRFISGYCMHDMYINTMKKHIEQFWDHNGKGQKLIISYHSLPLNNIIKGDLYPFFCILSANKIVKVLNMKDHEAYIGFQSKIKGQKWLLPTVDGIIIQLAKSGYKKVDIICPSFSVDCLETLEEVKISYQNLFQKYGGIQLRYISCLNDSKIGTDLLMNIIEENLLGWL